MTLGPNAGFTKSILWVSAALLLANHMAACSVHMEATRPTPVDLNDYQQGMSRDAVLERLGAPDSTVVESDGTSCDFYKLYTRGYGAGGKIPIAIAEGAADAVTLGLAEIILTPTEGVTKNEKHPAAFCYRGQTLVRIAGEGNPNASVSQNPPLALESTATAGASPSLTPSATPSPSLGTAPAATPSLAPTPLPTSQSGPSPRVDQNSDEN